MQIEPIPILKAILVMAVAWPFASPSSASGLCDRLQGMAIVAQDGTFLGRITNEYDSDSVLNEYGDYGSKYSDKSIWNEYGEYGGRYSEKSPFNKYASKPPVIFSDAQAVAYLSVEKRVEPTVHPFILKTCK